MVPPVNVKVVSAVFSVPAEPATIAVVHVASVVIVMVEVPLKEPVTVPARVVAVWELATEYTVAPSFINAVVAESVNLMLPRFTTVVLFALDEVAPGVVKREPGAAAVRSTLCVSTIASEEDAVTAPVIAWAPTAMFSELLKPLSRSDGTAVPVLEVAALLATDACMDTAPPTTFRVVLTLLTEPAVGVQVSVPPTPITTLAVVELLSVICTVVLSPLTDPTPAVRPVMPPPKV
jgi:hypothetical protein